MGKVIKMNGLVTRHDISADKVLEAAVGNVEQVMVIGVDLAGEPYYASSIANAADMLWWLEKFKRMLLASEE